MEQDSNSGAAGFYDEWTDKFLEVYDGNTIQGYRPENLEELHQYTIKAADLKDGQRLLDAGCGICGPSIYFANHLNIDIHAITVSNIQYNKALENIKSIVGKGRVQPKLGNFLNLTTYYDKSFFDRAIFLESLGHCHDPERVINELAQVIKSGGAVYIKDVFRKESFNADIQSKIDLYFEAMDKHYAYHTLTLEVVLKALRGNKFEIDFIKKPDYNNDTSFRDLFEGKFHISLPTFDEIQSPGEWLEIRCTKI